MAKPSAIALMYNALMAIGSTLDSAFMSPSSRLDRARVIAGDALREMNVEHTKEVQDALGIGNK